MNATPMSHLTRYRLLFQPLLTDRQILSFPCDESGCVDLDALSEGAKLTYYYARTVIGREFSRPSVLQHLN